MNIFKHTLYYNLGGEYQISIMKEANIYFGQTYLEYEEKYDEWCDKEIKKYSHIKFILGLEKEIILFIKEEKNIHFSFNILKASLFKNILFGSYIHYYVKEVQSKELKDKLKEIFDFIENNYVDSNKLSLSGLRNYRKKYLI